MEGGGGEGACDGEEGVGEGGFAAPLIVFSLEGDGGGQGCREAEEETGESADGDVQTAVRLAEPFR